MGDTGLGGFIKNFKQNRADRNGYSKIIQMLNGSSDEEQIDMTNLGMSDKAINNIKSASEAAKDNGELVKMLQGQYNKLGSTFTRVGGVIKNFAANIINGVLTGALIGVATWGISKVIKAIDSWSISVEEAKKITEEFSSEYNSLREEQSKTITSLSDVEGEFEDLSKGVNALGENVSLTEEQFQRYHEITKIIADSVPELVAGYDEHGNAIIRLQGNVESLTEAYKMNQKEAARTLLESKTDDGTYIQGITAKFNQLRGQENVVYAQLQNESLLSHINVSEVAKEYAELSKMGWAEARDAMDEHGRKAGILDALGFSSETTVQEYEEIHRAINEENQKLISNIQSATKSVKEEGHAYVQANSQYWDTLTDGQRKYVDAYIDALDFDAIYNNFLDADGLLDIDEFNSAMFDMVDIVKDLPEDKLQLRFDLATQLNGGDVTIGEYYQQLEEITTWLNGLAPETRKVVEVILGLNTEDKTLDQTKERLKQLMGDNFSEDDFNKMSLDRAKSLAGITVEGTNAIRKKIDELTEDGSAEAKEQLEEIKKDYNLVYQTINGKPFLVSATWKPHTLDDLENKLESATDNLTVEIKASAAVDSMADMKTAVASLSDLYGQTVKLPSGADSAAKSSFGFADPATLNSIESAFYKFSEELKKKGNDVAANEINAALENFERTLIEFPGDAKKAQGAIDELIGAYIDQTDIIQNLTKENAEWSKAQLKAMGITNADEVVESRLAKTNKKLSKSFSVLTESIDNYKDALKRGDEEQQEKELQTMATELNNIYDFTDSNGNKMNIFDTDFIKNNLDTIEAALNDTTGKFNELDRIASKEYLIRLRTETNDNELKRLYFDLETAMRNFDGQSIDIGSSMDAGPIFDALENIRKTTKLTMEEFMQLVKEMSGGTIEANVEYEYKDVEMPLTYLETSTGKMVTVNKQKLRIPKFTYTYVGKGQGVTPHYSSPSTNTQSGDGGKSGSGNNGNNKDETDETFDWIEVRIQRLDEEIARLDKTVGDTYLNWSKRNKALGKEIEKVTEEMKAHQHAYERYLQNANAVQINSGKELDKKDYGTGADAEKQYNDDKALYDAAVNDWKTGKYQKLVREGKIGKDDIEKIGNKYLADAIKEYQEYYNKAVAQKDAVQDKELRRKELNKQLYFDNVKTEFEGIIALFEKSSSIIDEQISRTQEHGYFVSAQYYNKQLDLAEKTLAKQRDEYAKLVAARDELVEKGQLEKGSEEWNNMTQEIMETEQSIQSTTTSIVKFNNELRQLKWDAFDFAIARIDRLTSETETYIDLLDSSPLFEENGSFNERGRATSTMYGVQYDVAAKKLEYYKKEYAKAQADLAKYPNNKDLIKHVEAMADGLWDSAKAMQAAEDAEKDLISNGISKHIEYLNKLIDKYKQSLSDAKD